MPDLGTGIRCGQVGKSHLKQFCLLGRLNLGRGDQGLLCPQGHLVNRAMEVISAYWRLLLCVNGS